MPDNLLAQQDQKSLVSRLPAEVNVLQERFTNVINIVDAADKLLALHQLNADLNKFYYAAAKDRDAVQNNSAMKKSVVVGTLAVAVPAAVFLGPLGLILGIAGAGLGALLGLDIQEVSDNRFEKRSADFNFYSETSERVQDMMTRIQNEVDPRVIVMSPQADQAFDKFPRLRERFALAKDIDKMRSDITGQNNLPSLEKQKPEL